MLPLAAGERNARRQPLQSGIRNLVDRRVLREYILNSRSSVVAASATVLVTLAATFAMTSAVSNDRHLSRDQIRELMSDAQSEGRTGFARKTQTVDVRPAEPGEVIVTTIAGEGKETQSKPAESGDWVARNRCEPTGNEEYLVKSDTFDERYAVAEHQRSDAGDGWIPAKPLGRSLRYVILRESDGEFTFDAPWGESMVARPGDAIVQDPDKPDDIYRVAAESFRCTYEVVQAPATAE